MTSRLLFALRRLFARRAEACALHAGDIVYFDDRCETIHSIDWGDGLIAAPGLKTARPVVIQWAGGGEFCCHPRERLRVRRTSPRLISSAVSFSA